MIHVDASIKWNVHSCEPPRELVEIKAKIKGLEGEILDLLREVTA